MTTCHEDAERVAALVETLYSDLPGGYDCDKELAQYSDSQTYGAIATSDIALFVERAGAANWRSCGELAFADLGSGLGKLVLAAASFFKSSLGVENAPERAAVAHAALERLKLHSPQAAARVQLVCGCMLSERLAHLDGVFVHNLVFSRALSRALESRLDCELREGALVWTVAELLFSKRCQLRATLEASYNWADGGKRPLYEYRVEGAPEEGPVEEAE
jgi:hypothetical protein